LKKTGFNPQKNKCYKADRLSRPPPLTSLDLSHLLVSVYLPFAALSALGLFTNRIDCGMNHLAADRQSTFCIDLTTHERALLWTLRGRIWGSSLDFLLATRTSIGISVLWEYDRILAVPSAKRKMIQLFILSFNAVP